jgi:hypothetical protein
MDMRLDASKWIALATEKDAAAAAQIRLFLGDLLPYMRQTPPTLFPEYTDHSRDHVLDVLNTCLELSSADAQNLMSAEDLVVLTHGVGFHDLGLHLTVESFAQLIAPNNTMRLDFDIKSPTWSDLWDQFILQSRRFDGATLRSLFGDTVPVQIPPADPKYWTLRDRMLAGEFVRRHHGRLAHELAVLGWPLVDGSRRQIAKGMPAEHYDIAGLIGRSHTTTVRATFDYISSRYHLRDYQRIHIIYLMCLLRIADYLQIQPERAELRVSELTKMYSPISGLEWRVHQSVKNITTHEADPESILVQGIPQNINEYLRLKAWLGGIQAELDLCWAIVGEVFGRFELRKLTFVLRRVRSNLDDEARFQRQVSYLAKALRFTTASNELLTLLVRPLYQDSKVAGLREIIQNAADAVRERAFISRRSGQSFEPTIEVSLSIVGPKVRRVRVRDNGVGMDADVVENYFLRAGASFRTSDRWRTLYAISGKSQVQRAGRFGVGALASFILGETLEVRTRHFLSDASQGLSFRASIDEPALDVRLTELPIGTEIVIDTNFPSLEFGHGPEFRELKSLFCPDDINFSVVLDFGDRQQPLIGSAPVPCSKDSEVNGWQRVDLSNGMSAFLSLRRSDGPWVNGIEIDKLELGQESEYHHRGWGRGGHGFSLSLVDADGNADIDLQRTTLNLTSDADQIFDAVLGQKLFYASGDYRYFQKCLAIGKNEPTDRMEIIASNERPRDICQAAIRSLLDSSRSHMGNLGSSVESFASYPFLLTSSGIKLGLRYEDIESFSSFVLLFIESGNSSPAVLSTSDIPNHVAVKYVGLSARRPRSSIQGEMRQMVKYLIGVRSMQIADGARMSVSQFIVNTHYARVIASATRLARSIEEYLSAGKSIPTKWLYTDQHRAFLEGLEKLVEGRRLLGAIHLSGEIRRNQNMSLFRMDSYYQSNEFKERLCKVWPNVFDGGYFRGPQSFRDSGELKMLKH